MWYECVTIDQWRTHGVVLRGRTFPSQSTLYNFISYILKKHKRWIIVNKNAIWRVGWERSHFVCLALRPLKNNPTNPTILCVCTVSVTVWFSVWDEGNHMIFSINCHCHLSVLTMIIIYRPHHRSDNSRPNADSSNTRRPGSTLP